MLSGSEKYYDDIYSAMDKDYGAEAEKIHGFIEKYKSTKGNMLLDVACGTGTHAGCLSQYYTVQGLDVNVNMLQVARKKHPEIRFTQGDMRDFDLHKQFDAVTCLFSAIGYMKTKSDLQKAIKNMSRHLLPGGVLVVEPWFGAGEWRVGYVSVVRVDKPELKIIRMSHAARRGRLSLLELEYLIGTSKGIEHIKEHHEFGLFTIDEYSHAFTKAGLNVIHDPEGIYGRGLYIGKKPN